MAASATYAVVLTPPGRGAVASVLVAGPRAVALVGSLVFDRSDRPLELEPGAQIRLGRWGQPDGEEVVVAAIDPQRVEIHCHGGVAASHAVCQRLVAAGCELINWQAFAAIDQPDPICRAASAALARAHTERAALILLDQYAGALARALTEIRDRIAAADWIAARGMVTEVLARWPIGRI